MEDLYIDDDFCEGISQSLAANMELMPTPDFFESFDFNFLTAEIFHTQEHEYDYTLTEGDKLPLELHTSDLEEEEAHDDTSRADSDHAKCDEIKQSGDGVPEQDDEPNVDDKVPKI